MYLPGNHLQFEMQFSIFEQNFDLIQETKDTITTSKEATVYISQIEYFEEANPEVELGYHWSKKPSKTHKSKKYFIIDRYTKKKVKNFDNLDNVLKFIQTEMSTYLANRRD